MLQVRPSWNREGPFKCTYKLATQKSHTKLHCMQQTQQSCIPHTFSDPREKTETKKSGLQKHVKKFKGGRVRTLTRVEEENSMKTCIWFEAFVLGGHRL